MEIVHSRCAGLDVHQKTVVACRIYPGNRGKVIRDIETFDTFTDGLLQLSDWLNAVGIEQVAMESTGEYWKPVYTILDGTFELLVANAQHLKSVPGRKTDVKDAEWIADLLRHGLLKASFIPSTEQRDVRELTRLRSSVIADRARAVNRLQKVLEQANLKLASVATDVTGLSARMMLSEIIRGGSDPKLLADLAQGRMRDKIPTLERALQGRVRDIHRFLLADALAQIDAYDERIERITQEIDRLLHSFEAIRRNLDTIPGVGIVVADTILAELGQDMSRFPTDHQAAAWAGLAPGNNTSGGKRLSGKTRKGSKALKRAMIQAVQAAAKTKNTYLSAFYHRVAARRGKKRAIVAVAHKLLRIAYHVIKNECPYHELGADFFDKRDRDFTARRLTQRLEKLGFAVSLNDVAA
jgi:transposase